MREKRVAYILNKLKEEPFISTIELCEILAVTEMTIRRDLKYMEDRKMLIRTHGGAKSADNLQKNRNYDIRKIKNVNEKKLIAKYAAGLVQDGDIIYLGTGTTVELMPVYLAGKKITVFTNSFSIISACKQYDMDFIVLGGRIRKDVNSIIPEFFIDSISKINTDKTFLGANGINGSKVTVSNYEEGNVSQTMLKNSKRKYLLIDSSKFNKEAVFTYAELADITMIITDKGTHQDTIKKYQQYSKIKAV